MTRKTPVRRAKRKQQAGSESGSPNVVFVGDRVDAGVKGVKTDAAGFVPREPIAGFNEGLETFSLPPISEQLAGPFYHKEAGRIVRLFPKLYKLFTPKG